LDAEWGLQINALGEAAGPLKLHLQKSAAGYKFSQSRGVVMGIRKIVAAASAVALVVTPTLASAQQSAAAEVAPAAESVEGEELRGGFIIPLIALIAIILGILAATHDGEDPPKSP
jgi:hypothetical protein